MPENQSETLTNQGHYHPGAIVLHWQLCRILRTLHSMAAVCALCQTNGDLKNSHVIPEFFYKLVYDPKPRRFRVISAIVSVPERYEQKGLRERLLCGECERKLARWEHWTKTVFVDGRGLQITQQSNGVQLSGLNYKLFKIFLLSLLWRMSVSKLDFFKHVKLGPHEERIRLALVNEDPLRPEQYPCSMIVVEVGGRVCTDWIVQPTLARFGGHHVYSLVIAGILLNFYVGKQPLQPSIAAQVLNERGEMTISFRNMREIPFLMKAARRLVHARDARRQASS